MISLGQRLGKFEVVAEIGSGGMSTVYKAIDRTLERTVALKVLSPDLARDREAVLRFQREAYAAASLRHPHIVTIYEVGQESGYNFIAMEFLEGESLATMLARDGALPPERVLRAVTQVAQALDYAHSRGYVHRDVKPGNIIVGQGGSVTLMDFGLAKVMYSSDLTRYGTLVGSPGYMSPEQVRGDPVGPPSDVYGLALVTYEMLTGVGPFQVDSHHAIMHAHVYEPPPRLRSKNAAVSPAVDQVVLKALAKNPQQRQPSAGEFARQLAAAMYRRQAAVVPKAGIDRPKALLLRQARPLVIGVAGIAALVMLGLMAIGVGRSVNAARIATNTTATAVQAQRLAIAESTRAAMLAVQPSATSTVPPATATPAPIDTAAPSATPTLTPRPRPALPTVTPPPTSAPTVQVVDVAPPEPPPDDRNDKPSDDDKKDKPEPPAPEDDKKDRPEPPTPEGERP
jgi:serine/threonine-protein kinase